MKLKFQGRPQEAVTLSHGDGDTITLTVRALPPGWAAWLRTAYPAPSLFVDGKPSTKEGDPEYNDLYGMLLIAKALEEEQVLETKLEGPHWRVCAEKIRAEFQAAGFVDGDLQQLLHALGRCNAARKKPGEELRGN